MRPADRPLGLTRIRSTFQLVEGRIAGVAQVRGMIYLNFDADWRRAFSAALRRSDRGLLGGGAGNPKELAGRLVRVRGWIEQRTGTATGPTIELSTAGQIEVLDDPDPAAAAARSLPGRLRPGTPRAPSPAPPEREAKPPGLIETGR